MIILGAGETLRGVASASNSCAYTIMGMELDAGGAEDYKVLAQGYLPNAAGTLYTAPALTTALIKNIHLAYAGVVSGIKLYVNGTAAGNQITPNWSMPTQGWAVYEDDGWTFYEQTSGAAKLKRA